MRQRKQKRLTAWLLTLLMAVSLLPGLGMTALAVEENESLDPPAVTAPTDPVDPIESRLTRLTGDPTDPVDPVDPIDPEPPKPPEEPLYHR